MYESIDQDERDMLKWEDRMERGGDDGNDHDPIPCPDPDCGGLMVEMSESNYGADRGGNRGMDISWLECPVCGMEGVE